MTDRATAALAMAALASACGAGAGAGDAANGGPAEPAGRAPIVTTERGPRGGHLVFVGEDGRRTADLTDTEKVVVLDRSPAWSPGGDWIAFASTRGRSSIGETSLWLVGAEPDSRPRRLTGADAVDRDPVWTPDGRALVFASSREGSFDLYRGVVAFDRYDRPRLVGEPERLTDGPAHELAPSVSPDGERIVYMVVEGKRDEAPEMTLWTLEVATGRAEQLTRGPRDMTPAWSPSGEAIAFAAPAGERQDTDLFLVEPGGDGRRVAIDEPYADQTGPTWSRDGRYLFATSTFRSARTQKPILASIVVMDTLETEGVLRALHDPVAVESRIDVALAPATLRARSIHDNPVYIDALREAVARQLRRTLRERRRGGESDGD